MDENVFSYMSNQNCPHGLHVIDEFRGSYFSYKDKTYSDYDIDYDSDNEENEKSLTYKVKKDFPDVSYVRMEDGFGFFPNQCPICKENCDSYANGRMRDIILCTHCNSRIHSDCLSANDDQEDICPNCGKDYNIDEYINEFKVYSVPFGIKWIRCQPVGVRHSNAMLSQSIQKSREVNGVFTLDVAVLPKEFSSHYGGTFCVPNVGCVRPLIPDVIIIELASGGKVCIMFELRCIKYLNCNITQFLECFNKTISSLIIYMTFNEYNFPYHSPADYDIILQLCNDIDEYTEDKVLECLNKKIYSEQSFFLHIPSKIFGLFDGGLSFHDTVKVYFFNAMDSKYSRSNGSVNHGERMHLLQKDRKCSTFKKTLNTMKKDNIINYWKHETYKPYSKKFQILKVGFEKKQHEECIEYLSSRFPNVKQNKLQKKCMHLKKSNLDMKCDYRNLVKSLCRFYKQ